ncbi:MAG: hypothetical protein A2284_15990 [Deltaproteobacteria bacterium RIFOXYA12_FULL_61_11]|nr:MAG: hypothetical protein A2284_15990 [Deltaproteobacteria bacterium RIFOXYA12_FULL_61_11]
MLDPSVLGAYLLKRGVLDESLHRFIFLEQKVAPHRIKPFLLEGGYLEETEFLSFVAKLYQLEMVKEDELTTISQELFKVVPLKIMCRHLVLPLRLVRHRRRKRILLAVENPFRVKVIEKIRAMWDVGLELIAKDELQEFLEDRFPGQELPFSTSPETETLQQEFADLLLRLVEQGILTRLEVLTRVRSLS